MPYLLKLESSLPTFTWDMAAIMPTWKLIRGWLPSAAVVTLKKPHCSTMLHGVTLLLTPASKGQRDWDQVQPWLYAWLESPSFQGCLRRPSSKLQTTFSPSSSFSLRRYSTSAQHQTGRPDLGRASRPDTLMTLYLLGVRSCFLRRHASSEILVQIKNKCEDRVLVRFDIV